MKWKSFWLGSVVAVLFVSGLFRFGSGADTLQSNSLTAAETSAPQIARVYPVREDVLALEIETGRVIRGEQQIYVPDPRDEIAENGKGEAWVTRNGRALGVLVGDDRQILYSLDRFAGDPLDTDWADRPQSYAIASPNDAHYLDSRSPTTVFRKSKPTDSARVGSWDYRWAMSHTLYLDLPQALEEGQTYAIAFPNSDLPLQNFAFDSSRSASEAIHVSQLGFRPSDLAKVGFLSTWMGNGGGLDYPEGVPFSIIDNATDRVAFSGTTQLSKPEVTPEDPRGRNYNGTDVYLADFSPLQQPGDYRLCVEGVGCSQSFAIAETAWQDAFYVSARGLYHQRSGVELGPPYSDYRRPRAFHPDDGVEVYQSQVSLMDTTMGLGDRNVFEALQETRTDEVVADAWGGYFDAGDWDRRIQHLRVARLLLELADLFPDYFARVNLEIPESSNDRPDLVDEALWGVDFFRRLQTAEGGIRGGIESGAHPKFGETSWQESLDVMAYAPDVWSSYEYAGVAARAARWLEATSPDSAAVYRDSALKAMDYAESHSGEAIASYRVTDSRDLAAIELYALTGDKRWHQLFLDTTVFVEGDRDTYQWQHHDRRDAAYVYARLPQASVDREVQANAESALLREANRALSQGQDTAFKWTKVDPHTPIGWGNSFGTPKAIALLRAHSLTQEPRYLKAAQLATQFAAGANPSNTVFTTGLGHRSPQHPLIVDARIANPSPPPGITIYGPLDLVQFADYWFVKQLLAQQLMPSPQAWPAAEAYFDLYHFPAVSEFTIQQTIAPTAYTWGYLAAQSTHSASEPSP
ncbi:glycoside hydrolase family 9 protein [Synechococcus sp. PCC 7336]|uniref:glycoside hydrolase family 9 protein n=1 Tax=Synechococcus sp. PCC 7336 TaxID=195250 RepID=UPI00034BD4D6|nr:glycoside hydrolase family 9 protein [Synechococcus sp. PCC 7336]